MASTGDAEPGDGHQFRLSLDKIAMRLEQSGGTGKVAVSLVEGSKMGSPLLVELLQQPPMKQRIFISR